MKKLMLLLVVLGMVAPAAMAVSLLDGTSHSAVFGCGACHEAHNKVETAYSGTPLWGLAMPASGTAYGTTARGSIAVGVPDGKSALCMSCHDASGDDAALSTHASTAAITTGGVGGLDDFTVTTNTSHPVSFAYSGDGDVTLLDAPINGYNAALDAGDVACSTCHDVHDAGGTTAYKALRGGFTALTVDDLCDSCHVK